MSVDEHVTDLLAAYALDILDEDEARQVREHLQICDACQIELRSFQKVVEELPLAAVEVAPPPMLKDKIMLQAQASKRANLPKTNKGWWQMLKEGLAWRTPAWGIVSLALIVLLAVSNLFLWQRLSRAENDHPNKLATVPLMGSEVIPGATGMLVISADGEHGTLVVDGLPALDASKQYQLWLIQDGQRTSGGVFSVDSEGYGSLWITSPKPLISYQSVGITVEPAGGSPAPTGERVLGGEL
jgi:anti-sigma-K factor RskA